jgi:succinate dehydrogenase/fumarate reductase flavoprotein subunit
MALRAGVQLANMEFTDCTLTPKGYSTQGLNAFMGGGAHLINSLGERFMPKYYPDGERAKRADLVNGVVSEILAGRGPIYCDCTHLPEADVRRLENTLGIDRPALPDFFAQKKIDLAKEPFEIVVGELATVRAGALFRGSGVNINADCASNMPGFFAAGDCSTMNAGIAGAAVMGQVAGLSAGQFALTQPKPRPVSTKEQERIRETLYHPLQLEDGLKFHQFEDEVRSIVTGLIGYRRDEKRLQEALRRLNALRARETEMIAEDYHGVMRVNEARKIRAVAEALAATGIERREPRGGAAHFRVDYPEKNDETGLRIFMVKQTGDELQVSSRPTGIPSTVLAEAPLKKQEV